MALFGPKPPVDDPPGNDLTEPCAPVSPAPTVREQHHAEILAAFETATAELAHAERVKVRATEVAREAARTVDQAREVVEVQRRLLRRVSEGHI